MIEKITIRNFKSIGEVTVDLSPVTVLVGRSGTGKSNFLAAIRFLRDYLLGGDKATEIHGGWQCILPAGRGRPSFSIDVTLRLPGFDDVFRYCIAFRADQNHQEIVGEYFAYEGHVIFEWEVNEDRTDRSTRRETKWITEPDVAPKPNLQGVMLGKLPTVTEAVLVFTALSTGIGWYDFPATVLTNQNQGGKQSIFGHNEATGRYDGLHDAGDNYLRVYQQITKNLKNQFARRSLVARLRQLNQAVRSVELDSIQNPQRMIIGHSLGSSSIALDIFQESDGFRRFFAHLLALYQEPSCLALLFEEPENGIYPGALEVLAEEFKAAPSAGRGQVILTTHSPGLLDSFGDESIRVVDIDSETQQTKIGSLDPVQRQAIQDNLLTPGELLTVDQARLDETLTTKEISGA